MKWQKRLGFLFEIIKDHNLQRNIDWWCEKERPQSGHLFKLLFGIVEAICLQKTRQIYRFGIKVAIELNIKSLLIHHHRCRAAILLTIERRGCRQYPSEIHCPVPSSYSDGGCMVRVCWLGVKENPLVEALYHQVGTYLILVRKSGIFSMLDSVCKPCSVKKSNYRQLVHMHYLWIPNLIQ